VLYAGFLLWLLGSIIPALLTHLRRRSSGSTRSGTTWPPPSMASPCTGPPAPSASTAPPLRSFSLLRDVLSHDTTPQIRLGHHGPEAAATAEAYWLKAALPAAH